MAGTYHLAVTLGGDPIATPPACIEVSHGGSAELAAGGQGVAVSPPATAPASFQLQGAGGLALEAWVKPRSLPATKASVVFKVGRCRFDSPIRLNPGLKAHPVSTS